MFLTEEHPKFRKKKEKREFLPLSELEDIDLAQKCALLARPGRALFFQTTFMG